MEFVQYPTSLFILQFLFGFIICYEHEPLALVKKTDDTYQITTKKFSNLKEKIKTIYDNPSSKQNPIHRFCPLRSRLELTTIDFQKKHENNLYYFDSIKNTDIEGLCDERPKPVVMLVSNPQDFTNIKKTDSIKWYMSGFKIHTRNIKKTSSSSFFSSSSSKQQDQTTIEYELLDEGFQIIPGLSIFFDENTHRTRAVKYELLPAEFFEMEEDNIGLYTTVEALDMSEFRQFFGTSLSNNGEISRFPLAPPQHFMYDPWANVARIDANLVPINKEIMNRIAIIDNELIRVAKVMGKLDIIAGTSVLKNAVTDANSSNRIQLPELIWKVVQRKTKAGTLGIILVVRNLSTDIDEKICSQEEDVCQKNYWIIREPGVSENEVYCCNMDETAIQNLNANFLELKKEEPFTLEYNKRILNKS